MAFEGIGPWRIVRPQIVADQFHWAYAWTAGHCTGWMFL